MFKKIICCTLLMFQLVSSIASEKLQSGMSDQVWEAIKIFEGSEVSVSSDFDCQGMSIGVAQWNVGKSYSAVKEIIFSVPVELVNKLMPINGVKLVQVLSLGKEETLAYVRSMQSILQPNSCDAKSRNARWNTEGAIFVKELAKVLATPHSISMQRLLRLDVFNNGKKNAIMWANAIRGQNAPPTLKELAYFVDMQNFNGGGFSKFGLNYSVLTSEKREECVNETIHYLKTADDDFLLHKRASRKNGELLNPDALNDSEKDLFCLSYLVALQLNANYSRQFRLTTINRRSAILFGEAYYADRDPKPVKILIPSPK